jgi:hypothetical protein
VRDRIWAKHSSNNQLTYSSLLTAFQRLFSDITEEEVQAYIQVVHQYQGTPTEFKISELEFKINHEPYFIFDTHKNSNSIIKRLFPHAADEKNKLESFVRRVKQICEPYVKVVSVLPRMTTTLEYWLTLNSPTCRRALNQSVSSSKHSTTAIAPSSFPPSKTTSSDQ